MNEDLIYENDNDEIAESLSLIYQRDSRRFSGYIDALKEVSV